MTKTWRRRLVAALFICNAGAAAAATDNSRPCEREMARASQQHGIPLGILYAVGGFSAAGSALMVVDAYDPATDTWTRKASMPTARGDLAVGVVNGILYAVGGSSPSPTGTALATLEAYDPATDTWTTKPSMPTARTALAAGVFNGILYAVGGYVANSLATLEVYQP